MRIMSRPFMVVFGLCLAALVAWGVSTQFGGQIEQPSGVVGGSVAEAEQIAELALEGMAVAGGGRAIEL